MRTHRTSRGQTSAQSISDARTSAGPIHGANFTRANLRGADFTRANLLGAELAGADLRRANFTRADLKGTGFSNACLVWTIFGDVDLRDAKDLEQAVHRGPSTIGIDTLYRSGGELPEPFLRGAGVPDILIAYMKSLTGPAFEFHSCFVSYSTADQVFADRLYADLQAKGVRCWYAPHHVKAGRKLHEQIDEAIRVYDKLLVVLSEISMNSEWVKTELAKARARELREKRRMLFPICLVPFERVRGWECFDGDTRKDTAREIREYFIPDFSNWKDQNSYEPAFERLLRDLKGGHAAA